MEAIEYKPAKRIDNVLEIRSRRRNEDLFEETVLEAAVFERDNVILQDLAKQFYDFKNFSNKEEDSEYQEDFIEDDSDVEELKTSFNTKGVTRKDFALKKSPIQKFKDGALEKLPIEKQEILELHKDEIFGDGVNYQQQIETVIRLIMDVSRTSKSGPTAISLLFGVKPGTIHKHYLRMNKDRRAVVGRPSILTDEQINHMIAHVTHQYGLKNSPNFDDLLDYVFKTFHISIHTPTLRSIIKRVPQLKTAIGIPLEESRIDVPLKIILDHYNILDALLQRELIPPGFFFNVDESGFQEFADARKEVVIVPSDTDEQTYYRVNRSVKRATLIGCICMDGSSIKPLVVSPNKTVTRKLLMDGYNDENCFIVSQENGFVSSEVFHYWFEKVFIPELKRKREKYEYDGLAVLTLDGCSSHISDFFLDECTHTNVYPFYEPAGTSDQVQALDLGIFGNQKKIRSRYHPNDDFSKQEKSIIDIVNSWIRATTPKAVIRAFNQAGIYVESTEIGTFVRASAEKARAVRGIEHIPCENIISGKKTIKVPYF